MAIGVAIIGSGIFVKEEHLPAVKQSPNLTLKAIYSRSLKSAESLGVDVSIYSDDSGSGKTYHDLLLRQDVAAVIIALPITAQPDYIEAALAAGKHVLSEKPIAGTILRAKDLIKYYQSSAVKGSASWSVAENFRFLDSFKYGKQEVEKLGRILGFRVKVFGNVKIGDKYFLDGGVHFTAGTRLLLGNSAKPSAVSAFTTLLQDHLPPVDTVNSIWLVNSGVSGTFSVSFGTTLSGGEYTIACEKGSVTIVRSSVTVRLGEEKLGNSETRDFKDEGSGVKQEVAAWAQGIVDGEPNPKQSPAEALADLEILEKMLLSGEAKGKTENLEFQI